MTDAAEAEVRSRIVEWCGRLWDRRLVAGTSGNVSARLEGGDLIVTPSSRSLGYLAVDDLVRVDATGVARDRTQRPSSELPLHLAAYRVRPDVTYVVHTHPTFSVVWSKTGSTFPRDTVGASESLGSLAWTAFHPNGTQALADECAREFVRGVDTVLMERHGLCTIGADLEYCCMQTELAEEAARIAYFSRIANLER